MTANSPFDLAQRRGGNELDSVLPFYKNSQVSPNLHRETRLCQTNSALIPSIILFLCVLMQNGTIRRIYATKRWIRLQKWSWQPQLQLSHRTQDISGQRQTAACSQGQGTFVVGGLSASIEPRIELWGFRSSGLFTKYSELIGFQNDQYTEEPITFNFNLIPGMVPWGISWQPRTGVRSGTLRRWAGFSPPHLTASWVDEVRREDSRISRQCKLLSVLQRVQLGEMNDGERGHRPKEEESIVSARENGV